MSLLVWVENGNVNTPLESVMVPEEVPSQITLAPGRTVLAPFSNTWPLRFWANERAGKNSMESKPKKNFRLFKGNIIAFYILKFRKNRMQFPVPEMRFHSEF